MFIMCGRRREEWVIDKRRPTESKFIFQCYPSPPKGARYHKLGVDSVSAEQCLQALHSSTTGRRAVPILLLIWWGGSHMSELVSQKMWLKTGHGILITSTDT